MHIQILSYFKIQKGHIRACLDSASDDSSGLRGTSGFRGSGLSGFGGLRGVGGLGLRGRSPKPQTRKHYTLTPGDPKP